MVELPLKVIIDADLSFDTYVVSFRCCAAIFFSNTRGHSTDLFFFSGVDIFTSPSILEKTIIPLKVADSHNFA